MLSRISKMSVFGIVALMLAFGLATSGALAAPGGVTISLNTASNSTNDNVRLRAAADEGEAAILTFEVEVTDQPDGPQDRASTIVIDIPSSVQNWHPPVDADTETVTGGIVTAGDALELGEVAISAAVGAGHTVVSGQVRNGNLEATIGKDAETGSVIFIFRSRTPVTRNTHSFSVTAPVHAITADSGTTITDRRGTKYIDVEVGPIDSGAGKVTLRRTSGGKLHLQPDPPEADKKPVHAGKYLLVSGESLSNLVITYEVPGTLTTGSQFLVTITGWTITQQNDSQAAVSSSVSGAVGRFAHTSDVVKARVERNLRKGDKIVVTLKGFSAPKVPDPPPEQATDLAIIEGYMIKAATAVDFDGDDDNNPNTESGDIETARNVGRAAADQFQFVITDTHGSGRLTVNAATAAGITAANAMRAASPDRITHMVAGTDFTPGPPGNGGVEFTISLDHLAGIGGGAKYEIGLPTTPGWPTSFPPIGANIQPGAHSGAAFAGDILPRDGTNLDAIPAADRAIVVMYSVESAPPQGPHVFTAKTNSGPHANNGALTDIDSYTIHSTVGHGTGTMVLTDDGNQLHQTTSEKELGNLVFTYTPAGYMPPNAMVRVMLPGTDAEGIAESKVWTRARSDDGNGIATPGEVTVSSKANVTVAADGGSFDVTATEAWTTSDRIVITYKSVKTAKVTGSATHTFTTTSSSFGGEANLSGAHIGDPIVGFGRAPDGGGSIALSVTEAVAGSNIGDLVITFTANGKMEIGSVVEITIPDSGGWPTPKRDVSQPGGVTVSDTASIVSVTATTMTANTRTELDNGDEIDFTYKNITAPSTGGRYTFNAESTSSYDGRLNPLSSGGAAITIKEVAPGLVSLSNADGALSSAGPGDELGNLTFTFTAGAAMESGSQVSIMFPAEWDSPFRANNAQDSRPSAVWVEGASFEIARNDDGSSTVTATTGAVADEATLTITYMMVDAPETEKTYEFTTMSSITAGGELRPVLVHPSVIVREPVTAIEIAADPTSVFTGGEIGLSVTLWAGTAKGYALGPMMIDLNDGEAGGTFTPASLMIADEGHEATATYTNSASAMVTITATSGALDPVTVDVEIKSTIRDLSVNGETDMVLVTQGSTIMVRATGPEGGGTVTVQDSDGDKVGLKKALDPVGEPDADGDQAYSRSVDLPDVLADGMYTVSVEIQGDVNDSFSIQVVNDQDPPTLSNAEASKDELVDGGTFTLSVDVAMNESMVAIESVTADLGGLDTTQATVTLDELPSSPGTYFTIITIADADANEAEDGEYTITVTATDAIGNESDPPAEVTVTLKNDVTAPELSDASALPSPVANGSMVTISVNGGESDLTVTANATAIGGDAAVALDEGMDANGNGDDMTDTAMPAGNGMYSGTVTVTDAEDGEQTITITATDGSSNESTVDVTVTIDNAAPMLSDEAADPSMANNGTEVTISVSSESGLTSVMANATEIGGDAAVELSEEMDADMAGTGVYSNTVTVADVMEDGDKTITITASDALENKSDEVTVTVKVDNTAPMLSDAKAVPTMVNNDTEVTISVSSESGLTTVMADATAIGGDAAVELSEEMDADMAGTGMYSVEVTVTDAEDGEQTITITAADALGNEASESVTVTVISPEVEPRIQDLEVDNALVKQDSTITVSVTGKAGGGTVTVLDSEGETVVAAKALDPDGDPDEDGDQAYTRSITLPEVLADGTYTVSVEIQGEMDSSKIEVVNDQAPPTLSEASARPVQTTYATNGKEVVLSVTVELNDSNIEINSVTADVSALDSTLTGDDAKIELTELPTGSGRYTTILTISTENMHDDGEVMVSFIATDRLGNESEAATASIRLKNDVTAPELSMESAMPSPAANDMVVTISVSSEPGLTVTADATAIGGDAAVALDEGMDANGNGNGMDANGNGNGNGMDANGNGNGNGMDANGNGNGNGMDANGNGDDMTETAMPAGNGVYSGMVTVTGAEDGEQTITITATDGSGNASTATVSVMIDNTGAMLSDASADPTMATNDTEVILSVNGGESGLTVTADASAIGGTADEELTESAETAGMYSATVTVTDAEDGEQMVTISATDALGNASEAVMVSVTVDNSGPTLSDATADPAEVENGDMVTISVMGGESGLTVMADASELGVEADVQLEESSDTVGSYSGSVEVNADSGGDKMVSITATDALGNASEAVTVMVSVHEVTSVTFSPVQVSTGDSVTVTAMGTAGLSATFNVFDAEAMNIVEGKLMDESAEGGTYTGSFEIVADAHPTGEYWVSASVGKASMTADDALTIDHKAQFTLSIAAGTHAIHVPLDVTHIDGEAGTIETVGDLYDALGESVNFIITLGADGNWMSYLGDESAGSMADAAIGDDTGLIAVMKSAATLELTGNALGTGGVSQINIEIGNNLVGVPLDPVVDMMISGALVEGVGAIAVSNAAGDGFHTITEAGQDGDGPIMGGVGYIVVATAAANIPIVGSAWENEGAPMAAPGVAFSGSQTPVLHVDGGVMDEFDMLAQSTELRVTVRNLSTGASLDTVLGTDESTTAYSATFVEFGRHAAKAGDVLEIVAHSPNPYVGVRPVPQIVVSAEEVLTSRISLPDLELYEIPSETELLANYPNPFNPETWIPYRLAQAAEVTLDIYDTTGRLVRTIDVGFKPAAVYESRASAIYWDGRNNYGERVASGTYFYHLTAGDDYASTRRMVILK